MVVDLDARDLTADVIQRNKRQKTLYRQELKKCMSYIKDTHMYQRENATTYNIPLALLGEPFYDSEQCVQYVKRKLIQHNFYVRTCLPGNRLFISWDPKHVAQVPQLQSALGIEPSIQEATQSTRNAQPPSPPQEPVVEYIPAHSRRRSHDELRKQVMQDISSSRKRRSKKRSQQIKIRRR